MTNTVRGKLFVISAPSGAGKTSLISALVDEMPNLVISVSYTTRDKRPGEIDGVHYNFVSQAEFEENLAKGEFLEHANVFGKNYGTSRKWVSDKLDAGFDLLLEIDWQGARQVKSIFPEEEISIFIAPPSMQTLTERLYARRQDTQEVIAERMALASRETSHYDEYDYLVINEDFDTALRDIKAIITAARLRTADQKQKNHEILQDLLAK